MNILSNEACRCELWMHSDDFEKVSILFSRFFAVKTGVENVCLG